jgi:hypothetical protein
MTVEQYTCELETLIEEAGLEIRTGTITRLAKRARELESEADFSEDDVYDELVECLSVKQQGDEPTLELVSFFSEFVIAEQDSGDGVDSSEDDAD